MVRTMDAITMTDNTYIEMDVNQILKLQHELSRILADVVDPMAGLAEALALVGDLPGLDGVWVWFRSEESGDFHLQESAGICDMMTMMLDILPHDAAIGQRLLEREEVVGHWHDIWPAQAKVIDSLGWTDGVLLPVISQGEVVGALGGGGRTVRCVEKSYLWVLRTLAHATGSLVGSIRIETKHRIASINLSRMLDSFSDRMFIVSAEGEILYHNRAAAAAVSAGRTKLNGAGIEQVLPGYDQLRQNLADGSRQAHLQNGNGELFPVEVRVNQGSWDGLPAEIVVCQDIAHRLVIEQKNQRLVTAINHVVESIVITNANGNIEYVNPAFVRRTGYSEDDAIGNNPRLLKSGEHGQDFYREMWQTLNSGQVWSGRVTNRKKNGEHYIEQVAISPVKNDNGIITHYVGVKRDVTIEIATEERLRESQKLEAIGTLAGGIAHDFNNILYALLGYVDLAQDDIPADHPAFEPLNEVAKAGERATSLVAKMLTFGRRGDGQREPVVLVDAVADCLDLVRAALPSTIVFEKDLAAGSSNVVVDQTQLHQAILNICTNAQYAMRDEGGTLRITVDEVKLGTGQARAIGQLKPGTWGRIQIADTGQGIDPAVLERIFEPYFTTRKSDEGTGLGLATVHGIVTSHGGHIFATSTLGVGSEFTIYLPIKTEAAEVAGAPSAVPAKRKFGKAHIMVIDDEPMVVDVLKRALIRFGYEVSAFGNGVEALEVFRASPNAFDVVITDQTMPNITGFELAHQMLAIRPDLPLILTTGYAEKAYDEQARVAGIRYYMPKPLKIAELGAALLELTEEVVVS